MKAKWLLLLGGGLLGTAVLIQFVVVQYYTDNKQSVQVANHDMHWLLDASVPGWQAQSLPLGPTEFYGESVKAELNLDDYFYQAYARDGRSFEVFVSYWRPDKMPVNLVASHTPDRCWTQTGWQCERYELRENLRAGSTPLQPAYWRLFKAAGNSVQHVLYWHLVGGRAQIYGGNTFNQFISWRYWWKKAALFGFRGSEEQYFVRVTSTRQLEELWNDAGFQEVMDRLARLGLARRPVRAVVR